ncbi:hypothetical protein J4Q44_G00113450 [Coregonus suidteri]|uniref:Deacetylase sirtuin-type domain-containing protein n=1 Tax=Coregonus suidteri TaxID=861788 RepID=A0AAN8LYL3_9TELE
MFWSSNAKHPLLHNNFNARLPSHQLSKVLPSGKTGGDMSKTRSSWDKRAPQGPALTRVTRSCIPQARHIEPPQPQDSGPGPHGTQQRKQTDSALPLAQDLSLMSVSGQDTSLPRKGRVFKGSSGPIQGGPSSSGSKPTQSSPSRPAVNPSPRGGLAAVSRLVKLGRCKNVVVVAGAGISTASGIPDFRTPGTGLYANLAKYNIPYPEAIFNIEYFSNDPRPFFSLAKELYPGSHRPNYIHYFIHMLHHKGLLLRMYTQNIDGLEKISGIPDEKLVEAHGSFATASCHLCYTPFPAQEAKSAIMSDEVPVCTFCQATVKPDIVFFGEDLPEKYFQHSKDFPKADLLIIMGTSLQIEPFASLVNTVRATVPAAAPEPGRSGSLSEGAPEEGRLHRAGRPAGHGQEVCRIPRVAFRYPRPDDQSGNWDHPYSGKQCSSKQCSIRKWLGPRRAHPDQSHRPGEERGVGAPRKVAP